MMTDFEKEKAYKEALGFLTSSLTNNENMEANLRVLEELGEYKDAPELLKKYSEIYRLRLEEQARLDKRRGKIRVLQWLVISAFLVLAGILIFILVYALRYPHL